MTEPLFNLSNAQREILVENINSIRDVVGRLNQTWWKDPKTGLPIDRNIGEMLMLVTSELAEAMEGHRKNLADDKLPQYPMFNVEIADAMIRLFDISYHLCPDIGYIILDKLKFNANREDHKPEHRLSEHGKRY